MDRVAEGEEITIAKHGRPMARMTPMEAVPLPRKPGGWEGKVTVHESFDEPLPPELRNAFGGTGARSGAGGTKADEPE